MGFRRAAGGNQPATIPETSANNLVGNVSTVAPASSYVMVGSLTLTPTANAPAPQDNLVFGASGCNGSALSGRLNSPGLPGQQLERPADNLSGDAEEVGNDQSAGIVDDGGDASGG